MNYDQYGRIKRIGSVYLKYRQDRLVQVGGLKLLYNRHGKFVGTRGQVNRYNHGYNYVSPDQGRGNGHNNWDDIDDYDDDNNYYYKKGDKIEKRSKRTLKK